MDFLGFPSLESMIFFQGSDYILELWDDIAFEEKKSSSLKGEVKKIMTTLSSRIRKYISFLKTYIVKLRTKKGVLWSWKADAFWVFGLGRERGNSASSSRVDSGHVYTSS